MTASTAKSGAHRLMRDLLPTYKELWEPSASGSGAQRSDAYGDWYAEHIHSFLPGTWVISGHHQGLGEIQMLLEAVRKIWTVRSIFHHNNYWLGEDTICTEWFSTNEVWTGVRCRNSGLTRQTFVEGQVFEWQEYTDSEFFEEMHAGWRGVVGPELGSHLSRYACSGPPSYPDPALNEWPLETSLSDGRHCAPSEMRDRLAGAIEFWKAPRSGSRDLFADDVDVLFQGRSWPLGGHHRGREGVERVFLVAGRIWPRPSEIVKTECWANEDSVLIHWFTRNETWKGRSCRNSGWAVWKFEGERVTEWRNYLDTSFYAEVLDGWREAVGPELGLQLPNWPQPTGSRYPDPMAHE